ncbi:MAG: hypothetical protein DRN04_11570 [Thermoprotei archaeon]|nr:MAG: hypothetical protein DRN04_11570 [Thermoprotei archaeon]
MSLRRQGNIVFIVTYISWAISIVILSYWNTIRGLVKLASLDEYSYLLAVPIIVAYIALRRISGLNIKLAISVQSIAFSLLLISISSYLYMISWTSELTLELQTLSLIFMFWAFTALIVNFETLAKIKSVIFLSLLITPIPRVVLDYMAALLSRKVAEIVAAITSAKLIIGTSVILKTLGPNGETIVFEVWPAYSGVVSLTGFVIGLPLILDHIYSAKAPRRRKVLAATISSISLLILLLLGNITRITLIILSGRVWGLDTAMAVFHTTPSIIWTVVAVIIVMTILFKIVPRGEFQETKTPTITSKLSREVLVFTLILLVLLAFITPQLLESTIPYTPIEVKGKVIPVEELSANITKYVFNSSSIEILSDKRDRRTEVLLNIPIVRRVTLRYKKTVIYAYIEGSDNPSQFHGWPVCLTFQGYSLDRYWTETIKGHAVKSLVTYIEASKGSARMLMAYIRVPTIVSYGVFEKQFFIRVTLYTPIRSPDITEKYSMLKEVISEVANSLQPKLKKTVISRFINVSFAIHAFSLVVALANVGLLVYSRIVEKE